MELYIRLTTWIADFKEREDGVTAIEYGLLAAVIAIVMAVGAALLGTSLSNLFSRIGVDLDAFAP